MVPRISDPRLRPVLIGIPRIRTCIQRERRAIIYAIDRISKQKLLTSGTDSNVEPLVALTPPSVEVLTPQGDGRMWDIGDHASIKHCINASFEAPLRCVVNVSTITLINC